MYQVGINPSILNVTSPTSFLLLTFHTPSCYSSLSLWSYSFSVCYCCFSWFLFAVVPLLILLFLLHFRLQLLYTCQSVYMSACFSITVCLCLSFSLCLFVCLSVFLSDWLSLYLKHLLNIKTCIFIVFFGCLTGSSYVPPVKPEWVVW